MRVLFLDTETNGLPKNRYAPPKMVEAWPAVAQLAWQVWDISMGKVPVKLYDSCFFVKPRDGEVWDKEAAAVHGITEAQAKEQGYSIAHVLSSLTGDAAECDVAVAHNMAFDKNVLWAASYRIGVDPRTWWPEKEVCTMLETVAICKIPSKYPKPHDPYKWPRLPEVWTTLFPATPVPSGLHNARQDVAVMVSCFHALLERRLLVLEDKGFLKSCRFTDFFRDVLAILAP
jgi:DNA polymerase III epsilon subunit-like protein